MATHKGKPQTLPETVPDESPKPARKGRPQVEIDWVAVQRMLTAYCSGPDIADALGISESTLYKRCKKEQKMNFSTWAQRCKAGTRYLLRAAQIKEAFGYEYTLTDKKFKGGVVVEETTRQVKQAPSVAMQIWLGKQLLDQKEPPMEVAGKDKGGFGAEVPGYDIVGDDEQSTD